MLRKIVGTWVFIGVFWILTGVGVLASEMYPPFGEIPKPSEEWRIGHITKTLINDYYIDLVNGFEDAAKKYGVKVDTYAAPTESDLLLQKQIMDDMLAKKYDLICVGPISDTNLLTPLARATRMGIPIINTNDAHITPEAQKKHSIKIITFITADFAENLRLLVRYVAEKLGPEGGEVMHIMGMPGGRAAELRRFGYEDEIKKFPQLKSVAIISGDWDRKKAMDIAADMLQSSPDLKAIFAANDTMALGAVQAVKNIGKLGEVMVVGCDAIPDAIQSIKKGEVDATVAFMQYEMGYMSVEAAILYLEGRFEGKPTEIYASQEVWDRSNIDQKIEKYKKYYTGLKKLTESQ